MTRAAGREWLAAFATGDPAGRSSAEDGAAPVGVLGAGGLVVGQPRHPALALPFAGVLGESPGEGLGGVAGHVVASPHGPSLARNARSAAG